MISEHQSRSQDCNLVKGHILEAIITYHFYMKIKVIILLYSWNSQWTDILIDSGIVFYISKIDQK